MATFGFFHPTKNLPCFLIGSNFSPLDFHGTLRRRQFLRDLRLRQLLDGRRRFVGIRRHGFATAWNAACPKVGAGTAIGSSVSFGGGSLGGSAAGSWNSPTGKLGSPAGSPADAFDNSDPRAFAASGFSSDEEHPAAAVSTTAMTPADNARTKRKECMGTSCIEKRLSPFPAT